MTSRDPIVEELHKIRERIGRAHDFDVARIAATIRRHEVEAGLIVSATTRRKKTPSPLRSRRAAQHGLQPTPPRRSRAASRRG